MVSMDYGMRSFGLPALVLWDTIFQRPVKLIVHEDNQAMIRIVETGKNISLRYLQRTHRISVGWLHEVFKLDEIELMYEESAKMAADIYTKAFTDKAKWTAAHWLVGVVDPKDLQKLVDLGDAIPPQGGGAHRNPRRQKTSGMRTVRDIGLERTTLRRTSGPLSMGKRSAKANQRP